MSHQQATSLVWQGHSVRVQPMSTRDGDEVWTDLQVWLNGEAVKVPRMSQEVDGISFAEQHAWAEFMIMEMDPRAYAKGLSDGFINHLGTFLARHLERSAALQRGN